MLPPLGKSLGVWEALHARIRPYKSRACFNSIRGGKEVKRKISAPIAIPAVVALAMIASSAVEAEDGAAPRSQHDASQFTYARLYCTQDNETHFADLTVELAKQNFAPPAAPIYIGGYQQASKVFLGGFEAQLGAADLVNHLYHPTPAVQFITVVAGTFSITATDGETRQLHAGDVARLEDVTPCKGHITVAGDTLDSCCSLAEPPFLPA